MCASVISAHCSCFHGISGRRVRASTSRCVLSDSDGANAQAAVETASLSACIQYRNLFKPVCIKGCLDYLLCMQQASQARVQKSSATLTTMTSLFLHLASYSIFVQARVGVVVIGATNRPDHVDMAMLRPGRFDRLLYVPPPDVEARQAILGVHTRKTPLSSDLSLQVGRAASSRAPVACILLNLYGKACREVLSSKCPC